MVQLRIYKPIFFLEMCGILAILLPDGATRNKLKKTMTNLQKRGPDEIGHYEDKNIFIGHTRLSIVHPEAGAQPIHYKGWVGSMNGEIYNAKPTKDQTDCHHLVASVIEHGIQTLSQMDGMFSFFLYHPETKRVIMGRDPIGITPMYYSQTVVSSLLACQTKGVSHVPTGSAASFTLGCRPTWHKYVQPYQFVRPSQISLVSLMVRAVSKRLMGDVPWGVLLSGGLDSSIIAAIAVNQAAKKRPDYPKVHTFCIGLENSPDMIQAKRLADDLGTHHTGISYTASEGISHLRDVIRAVETYDVTTIRASTPMWLLGRAINKRGIKMVLSGEGSDELFAGYLYNLYCPGRQEMEDECRRKVADLYAYDCARANKSMGDWSIETRVPFLDNDVVDYAMNGLDPTTKLSGTHPEGPKAEKWFLRETFQTILPSYITERTKAQFSDAVGSEWISELTTHAEQTVSGQQLQDAAVRWPFQTPETKEAYLYRQIFDELFSEISGSEETVIYQPSIACSTYSATKWHEKFQTCLDPSGDAIQRAFKYS